VLIAVAAAEGLIRGFLFSKFRCRITKVSVNVAAIRVQFEARVVKVAITVGKSFASFLYKFLSGESGILSPVSVL